MSDFDRAIASQKGREATMRALCALAADIEWELEGDTPQGDLRSLVDELITLTSSGWAFETHVRETMVRRRRTLFGPTRPGRRSPRPSGRVH